MTEPVVKFYSLRLPEDVKTWLEREARRNLSSQNSEIVRAIRWRMEHCDAAQS